MAKQTVNRGSTANDGTGDTLRDGAGKINDNFNEIYSALGDGSDISLDTAATPSNTYLQATFTTNTVVRQIETNLVTEIGNANTATQDRMQVANVNTLVDDRLQVANAQVYITVANAQSYLEVANATLDTIISLGNTTSRDLTVGSLAVTGDTSISGNLTSFDLHANVTLLAADTNGNSTVLTLDNRNTVGNLEIMISQNGNKRAKLQFSNQEFGLFANVGPAGTNTPSQRRFAVDYITGNVKFNDEYTFPNIDGLAGEALVTDGNGLISFTPFEGTYVTNTYFQAILALGPTQIQTSIANAYSGGANVFFFNSPGGIGNVALYNDQNKLRHSFTFTKGVTYRFVQTDPSNAGHTLRFGTGPDGTLGGYNEYAYGVTRTGTPGSAGAATSFKIPLDAPACLFFYSSGQAGLGGPNTNDKTPFYTQWSGAFTDINGPRTMSMKDDLVVDCFSNTGTLVMKLPPSDEGLNLNLANNSITVRSIGNSSSPFVTIDRNGHKINGQTANVVVSGEHEFVSLAYRNTSNGFIILDHAANVYLRSSSTEGHSAADQLN